MPWQNCSEREKIFYKKLCVEIEPGMEVAECRFMNNKITTTTSKPASVKPLQGFRILVADDVTDNQILIRYYLEAAGANVEIANNGEEALQKSLMRFYDVIIMDIQMPKMDGLQATKKLRAKGYSYPILALTAHAMHEEVIRSLEAGCNEHLTKPIERHALIAAIADVRLARTLH